MIADLHKDLGQAILNYTTKAYKDDSLTLETVISDLKAIFKEFNVDDSNWITIDTTNPEQGISVMPYIRKKAENILRKRDLNKERSENNSQAGQDAKEKASEKQNKYKGKKRPIALNITDWGPIPHDALREHIAQLLVSKGNFTPDELTQPLPSAGALSYSGAGLDLNIQSENAVDQLVETIKRLYFVLVMGIPVKFVRKIGLLELNKPIVANLSKSGHWTDNGFCLHEDADPTKDIYISSSSSGASTVSDEDALTQADRELLKRYFAQGVFILNVGTHTELETLINSGKVPKIEELESASNNHFSSSTIEKSQ